MEVEESCLKMVIDRVFVWIGLGPYLKLYYGQGRISFWKHVVL